MLIPVMPKTLGKLYFLTVSDNLIAIRTEMQFMCSAN